MGITKKIGRPPKGLTMISLATSCPRSDETPAYCINASELPCPEDPLQYDIMRYPVTVGRSVRNPENLTVRDLGYVMDCIRHGDYEGYNLMRAIPNLRKMPDKEAQKTAKLSLPWFSGSLMQHKRSNINVKHAQFQIFDLDHVSNPEQLKELAISKFPWLRYAFRSAVDGVKLIGQFTKAITNEDIYRRIYVFLALQIEWTLKHGCDTTSDWARACFMSYDPNLLVNPNCYPLDASVTYKQAVSVMEIPFPREKPPTPNVVADVPSAVMATTDKMSVATDDYAKAEQIVSIMSKIPIVYKDWIKIGQALYAGFGEQGKALWDMFLNNPNYHDTQKSLDAHWHSFHSVRSIKLGSLFYVAEQYGVKYE